MAPLAHRRAHRTDARRLVGGEVRLSRDLDHHVVEVDLARGLDARDVAPTARKLDSRLAVVAHHHQRSLRDRLVRERSDQGLARRAAQVVALAVVAFVAASRACSSAFLPGSVP
ncbi:MAG: hypothetical protein U0326_29110 [Polyangiales bacterium]